MALCNSDDKKNINILKYLFEKEPAGSLAFIISIISIAMHGFGYLKGDELVFYPPQQFTLFWEKDAGKDNQLFLNINSLFSYVNKGDKGQASIVIGEGVYFYTRKYKVKKSKGNNLFIESKNTAYHMSWLNFEGLEKTFFGIQKTKGKSAGPILIDGGDNLTHATTLHPSMYKKIFIYDKKAASSIIYKDINGDNFIRACKFIKEEFIPGVELGISFYIKKEPNNRWLSNFNDRGYSDGEYDKIEYHCKFKVVPSYLDSLINKKHAVITLDKNSCFFVKDENKNKSVELSNESISTNSLYHWQQNRCDDYDKLEIKS